jgi:hypothetical protein
MLTCFFFHPTSGSPPSPLHVIRIGQCLPTGRLDQEKRILAAEERSPLFCATVQEGVLPSLRAATKFHKIGGMAFHAQRSNACPESASDRCLHKMGVMLFPQASSSSLTKPLIFHKTGVNTARPHRIPPVAMRCLTKERHCYRLKMHSMLHNRHASPSSCANHGSARFSQTKGEIATIQGLGLHKPREIASQYKGGRFTR